MRPATEGLDMRQRAPELEVQHLRKWAALLRDMAQSVMAAADIEKRAARLEQGR